MGVISTSQTSVRMFDVSIGMSYISREVTVNSIRVAIADQEYWSDGMGP